MLSKELSSGGSVDTRMLDAKDEAGGEDTCSTSDAVLKEDKRRIKTASVATNSRICSLCSQKGDRVSATGIRNSLSKEESPTSSVPASSAPSTKLELSKKPGQQESFTG